MKFTIIDIITEKAIDGNTCYIANSEDGVRVYCTVSNRLKITRKELYDRFMHMHNCLSVPKCERIQIGEIIERGE